MKEDPFEVSMNGVNGTLKSPPTIRVPTWKLASNCSVVLKKETWPVLGA